MVLRWKSRPALRTEIRVSGAMLEKFNGESPGPILARYPLAALVQTRAATASGGLRPHPTRD